MKSRFADAYYWVALLNDQDQGHSAAKAISKAMQGITLITTEEALTEVLAFFSERGRYLRQLVVELIDDIHIDPDIIILQQSHQTFSDGYALYKARPDKGYSLTDCISMLAMRRHGITEVLSHDDHFVQEGFIKLL